MLMVGLIVGNLFTILGLTTNLSPLIDRVFLFGGPAVTVITSAGIVFVVLKMKRDKR
ncbi:putative membrane protein [Exiguobacterium sp. S17]|nr:putative membrane protein [Exiguobacterium sp. S17]